MTPREQAVAFATELDALVSRFGDEFDLLAVTAVGVLMTKAHLIMDEQTRDDDEH